MKREQIMLKTINDVKAFVNSVAKYDFDVDLLFRQICRRCKIHYGNLQPGPFQGNHNGNSFG